MGSEENIRPKNQGRWISNRPSDFDINFTKNLSLKKLWITILPPSHQIFGPANGPGNSSSNRL
jgi:hypothetical protein